MLVNRPVAQALLPSLKRASFPTSGFHKSCLAEWRPVFDLVRAWRRRPPGAAFDEFRALRAEVERPGRLVEEAARRLVQAGRHAAARQLRQERASAGEPRPASRSASDT